MKKKNNEVALHTGAALKEKVALQNWLKKENKLFSAIVEETVTNGCVLRFYNAGISFCVMALSANYSMITASIGLAWFITAVMDLKNNVKKK